LCCNSYRRTLAGGALALLFVSSTHAQKMPAALAPAINSPMHAVLSQAVLTRALAIEKPGALTEHLASFPEGLIAPSERKSAQYRALWSLFFKGSLTKVSLNPHRPHILYLNPLADVAVIAECAKSKSTGKILCQHLCAMPGEALADEVATRSPYWVTSKRSLEAIQTVGAARVQSFTHIYESSVAKALSPQLCSQKSQVIAEVRLLDLLLATENLNSRAFSKALADYGAAKAKEQPVSTREGLPNDVTLSVLVRAPALSVSAAVPVRQEGWLVFLTPKSTGWTQAVLTLKKETGGALTLQSSTVLKF
jgi:hypothetical protein